MSGAEIVVPVVLALAAFILAFIGFGFALVAVPLLALVLPVKLAVGISFPFICLLTVYNSWRYGRPVDWKVLWPLLAGCVIAMPLGFISLNVFPESFMKKALAVFIILAVVSSRLAKERLSSGKIGASPWWGILMGIVSGWFNGAYTTGGPPAILYFLTVTDNPAKIKGLIGVYYILIMAVLGAMFFMGDVLTSQSLMISLKYSPAVILGAVIGVFVFKRIGNRSYRLAADGLLVLAAVLLWFRS
jgi:uncharacterized membrane protein YfcA